MKLLLTRVVLEMKTRKNLILAAAGRIEAAIEHGQTNFDDMEYGHQKY